MGSVREGSFVLGLDLDGVCANYTKEFGKYVSRFTGVPEADLPEPSNWSFEESGWPLSGGEYMQYHSMAVQQGMFRAMEPMPGVSEALWELSDADVSIRVITHRLLKNKQHQLVAADTAAWLDVHNIPYRDLCFLGEKSDMDADLFIDDAPHNLKALSDAGKNVVAFTHLYNADLNYPRVANWVEAKNYILKQKTIWENGEAC